MEFPKPKLKRKKGVGGLRWLVRGKEKEKDGRKCRGILVGGGSVIVDEEPDISTLLRLGFYGKGVFSRSFPTHVSAAPGRTRSLGVSSDECSSSGGGRGELAGRKRARPHLSQSEASEEEREQRKRRRLLLHAEWSKERQRLLSQQEAGGLNISGEPSTPVELTTTPGDCRNTKSSEEGGGGDGCCLTVRDLGELPTEDPYPVMEPLCLTAEEAFYLTAELDILNVSLPSPPGSTPPCLPLDLLWKRLCDELKKFPFTYSVYRHYRKKGWVPKLGHKFGVDFILYKDGPDSYHSSYAVLVCEDFEEGPASSEAVGAGCEARGEQRLRWMDIIAHCRVCESTAKNLVVVHVTVPRGCDEASLRSSPEFVEKLRLSETLVQRWVPDKDR